MKVCIFGLWHLGSVTAACLASRGIASVGLAESAAAAAALNAGKTPLYEPGLDEMVEQGLQSGSLTFTSDPAVAVSSTDLLWVTFDTPIDDNDVADTAFVLDRVRSIFPYLKDGSVVLLSSQLPVGSTALLERNFSGVAEGRRVSFAYSPENLRLGDAIRVFTEPERIVIGIRDGEARRVIEPVLAPFCDALLWVRVESAEMVKHALNSYLATCITFTNEIASICEDVAADMREVETALRLDPRVGSKAYVRAGAAFGGGTLARDVQFLKAVALQRNLTIPVLRAVLASNEGHKEWVLRRLRRRLNSLAGKRVGVLGLSYKAGTDAIRRSSAIEIITKLIADGAEVTAFDPKVSTLPEPLASAVIMARSPDAVFAGSSAVVFATEWPQFRDLDFGRLVPMMVHRLLVDQNGFAVNAVAGIADLECMVAGRGQ